MFAPAVLVAALLSLLFAGPPALAAAWHWPLAGVPRVTRVFAPGPTPYSPGHRGVDLAGVPGQPVLAAGAGRVSYAGLLAGRGVVVVVHGDLRTTYEPVHPVLRAGQLVDAGQQIGLLQGGHEGCPAPACLHWGLLRGQVYLDPLRLLTPGPVRLLPRPAATGARAPAAARGSPGPDLESAAAGDLGARRVPAPQSMAPLDGGRPVRPSRPSEGQAAAGALLALGIAGAARRRH